MTAPAYDFTDLTPNQRALLAVGGWDWGCMRSEPTNETVEPLIARGLLVRHHTQEYSAACNDRRGPVRRSFEVPTDVQLAWWDFFDAECKAADHSEGLAP